jgi:short-subunit dehydrogenase
MYGVNVSFCPVDANNPAEFTERLTEAFSKLQSVDALICPIGISTANDDGMQSLEEIQTLINTNFLAVVTATRLALPFMLHAGRGTIVGFSSVAAARGRSSNVVYSAAKRALESFFESLRHQLVGRNIRTIVYRLGYIATRQSYGKKLPFPVVSPESTALRVANNLSNSEGRKTWPLFWRPIVGIVQLTPWSIFKRLKF